MIRAGDDDSTDDYKSCAKTSWVSAQYSLPTTQLLLHRVKKRAPFPIMVAVYVFVATDASIDLIVKDWHLASTRKIDQSTQLYTNAVFLYFTSCLSDCLVGKLKVCPPLMLRFRACSESNMDFLAKEDRAFSLDAASNIIIINGH